MQPLEEIGWEEKYPELVESKIKVIDTKSLSLYDLFAESMIQVGVCSTALYEGLAFGLQTYVIDAQCADIMDPLVNEGYATKVTSPSEILTHISETSEIAPLDSKSIFKENALENALKFFERFNK